MIPKLIHYCWFGKTKKTKLIKNCIASWKLHLKDYKIIEWNEDNCDLTHPFVKNAYKRKKWAFVSDYIRLQKLYEYGGVYLDTDMMLFKSFNNLLNAYCFFGAEDKDYISCGVIGAVKNHHFIKSILSKYDNKKLNNNLAEITIPKVTTSVFKTKYEDVLFDKNIKYGDITIYPPKYFYPLPLSKKNEINNYKKFILPETYAIHLWSSSWVDYSEFYYLKNRQYIKGIKKVLKVIVNKKEIKYSYVRKIAWCVKFSITK